MKSLLFITVILAQSIALATGQERGNGGDAVVCYNPGYKDAIVRDINQITSVELLDLYEGRVFRGMSYDFPVYQSYLDVAREQIEKLEKLSPFRSRRFKKDLDTFETETIFAKGIQLKDIDDSNHIAVPINCKIEQLIIQKNPEFPGERRYTVDGDLWDKMDASNKSATVTHEFFYFEKLNSGDSRGVRHINALINSNAFVGLTSNQWFMNQFWFFSMIEYQGEIFVVRDYNPPNDEEIDWEFRHQFRRYWTLPPENRTRLGLTAKLTSLFGLNLTDFEVLSVNVRCDFVNCDFGKKTAFSTDGAVEILEQYDINLGPGLRAFEITVERNNSLSSLMIGELSKNFRVVLPNFTIQTEQLLRLKRSELGQWLPIIAETPNSMAKLKMIDFSEFKNTKVRYVNLENGKLIIGGPHLHESRSYLLATQQSHSPITFTSSGNFASLQLKEDYNKNTGAQEITFADGRKELICESEVLSLNDDMMPLFNYGWSYIKTKYPVSTVDCWGIPKEN